MGDWSYIYYPFCFPIIIEELKKEMYKRGLVYTRPTMNVVVAVRPAECDRQRHHQLWVHHTRRPTGATTH